MSSKLLVIIASGERETARTGLMYARNALRNGWMEDVKVVFFGPSESLVVEDDEVAGMARDVALAGESFACKAISDREGLSEGIGRLGVKVEYVGSIISNLIKDGYAPMVW
ncbi:hypothetical protein AC482_02995 [miscellaneous Crenarchaeota group-15 archaeon DG-45]|uniref:DsrE family protein n=1 Tax=miscellaneous Crenarchaeota group-15 archaeon DG-45 TaxID=1685127 RepID=A0A0M0BQC6_9ARCH|nr:MAG: hypothetical protein AC482_02995 [miscellaneous Crenarchaeota group-15 archaeon DG-45]